MNSEEELLTRIKFSIELAKAINGEIINADSMQVYKRLDIITNKHPLEEREGIPHHVMDHVDWNEEYFIHRFSKEANMAIEDIHNRGKIPIIIGGTHYYLQNLLFKNKTVGENKTIEFTNELKEEDKELLDGPVENIFNKLQEIDPIIAEKFHPEDKRKLRRALEIYITSGKKPSDIYYEQKLDELEDTSLKYNTLLFWVYSDPDILKERLDKRVDKMMELGALDEIKEMYSNYTAQNPKPECTNGIWQVIGFKEFLPWLETNKSLDEKTSSKLFNEGIDRMKIRTRQYAKYQVKWIKKLLAVELNKEARFNFKYGGKLYLLDATDLEKWNTNVGQLGLSIANQFTKAGPTSVSHPQAPTHLQHIFPTNDFLETFNSNKKLGSEKNWKHYECTVCKDKQGKNLVAVGEENWDIHLKSRRHKRQVGSGERKRKHEQMIKQHKELEGSDN